MRVPGVGGGGAGGGSNRASSCIRRKKNILAMTILVSPITDTSAATRIHFEDPWPSHPVFTPTLNVTTDATMMTPIPIDAGTIDLRQNASAECRLAAAFIGRRRWIGMTIATFLPVNVLCSTRRPGASGEARLDHTRA